MRVASRSGFGSAVGIGLLALTVSLAGCSGGTPITGDIIIPTDLPLDVGVPDVVVPPDQPRPDTNPPDVPGPDMGPGPDGKGPDAPVDQGPGPDEGPGPDGSDGPGPDVAPDAPVGSAEACDSAMGLTSGVTLGSQTLIGRTDDLDLTVDPSAACDLGGGFGGAEAVYSISVGAGSAVTITATPDTGTDLVLALVTDCSSATTAASSCVDISDDQNDPERPEVVTFRNSTNAAVTVFAIVEPFDDASAGVFSIRADVSAPQVGDTCADAPTLVSGVAQTGHTAGNNDYDVSTGLSTACVAVDGISFDGPDRTYRIAVPSQNRLSVTVTPTAGWDPAVLIVTNCDTAGPSCVGGNDDGGFGEPDTATFDNTGTGEVIAFVLIDSFSPFESGPYSVTATLSALPGNSGGLTISEIVNQGRTSQGDNGEFIEINYQGSQPLSLTDVYLSDRNDYHLIANGTNNGALNSDFVARFPATATISNGQFQTIAMASITNFQAAYPGVCPTYTLRTITGGEAALCPAARRMLGVDSGTGVTGSYIGTVAGLTNAREPVTLFTWDGQSDLVTDIDYVFYGTTPTDGTNPGVDKTGVVVGTSTYNDETALSAQIAAGNHGVGGSLQRCDFAQATEVPGGNGQTANDPTSECWAAPAASRCTTAAFKATVTPAATTSNATPNAGPPAGFCP